MDNKILEQAKQILSKQDTNPLEKAKSVLDEKEYAMMAVLIARAEVALWQDRLAKGAYSIAKGITISRGNKFSFDQDNSHIYALESTEFIVPVVFSTEHGACSFATAITQGASLED